MIHFLPEESQAIPIHDIKTFKIQRQYFADADLVITEAECKNKIFFLLQAKGTGLELTNGGKVYFTGQDFVDFSYAPVRLSREGFSLLGTTVEYIYGFTVPSLAWNRKNG